MKRLEDNLQRSCVKWWDLCLPKSKGLLFAVPNGGNRNVITARILKSTGVRAGVADLILLWRGTVRFIELKAPNGKQQPTQKDWQALVEAQGFEYKVIRSFDEFREYASGIVAGQEGRAG